MPSQPGLCLARAGLRQRQAEAPAGRGSGRPRLRQAEAPAVGVDSRGRQITLGRENLQRGIIAGGFEQEGIAEGNDAGGRRAATGLGLLRRGGQRLKSEEGLSTGRHTLILPCPLPKRKP